MAAPRAGQRPADERCHQRDDRDRHAVLMNAVCWASPDPATASVLHVQGVCKNVIGYRIEPPFTLRIVPAILYESPVASVITDSELMLGGEQWPEAHVPFASRGEPCADQAEPTFL